MPYIPHVRAPRFARGAGLMETMIGVTIGLIVVLVIYNLLAVSEGYKRMTMGQSDAQATGLISNFLTGFDAGNGGFGLSSAYSNLITCHFDAGGANFIGREDRSLKPIPVAITRSGDPDVSDSFISRTSASIHVVWPVPIRPQGAVTTVAPGAQIRVQTPMMFLTPAKASLPTATNPHWAVVFANDGSGKCELIKITNASPTADMDTTGDVMLTQGTPATTMTFTGAPVNTAGTGAFVLSLGRDGDATRVRYDVDRTLTPCGTIINCQAGVLRATDCMTITGCTGQPANPIAQNVVLMKVQYGIDTSPLLPTGIFDATVDCWTSDTETCPVDLPLPAPAISIPDWDPSTLVKAGDPATPLIPASAYNRIVAVRIGLVVQSDEPDERDPSLFVSPAITMDLKPGTRPPTGAANSTYLFNCAANTDAGCPGRVRVSAGSNPTDIMQNGYRYRVYEAVIPLRNSIFHATLPP